MDGKYGAIGTENYSCHEYDIINFSSSPYTLKSDLSIDGQVILSGETVREGTYFHIFANGRHMATDWWTATNNFNRTLF